jgi:hypothetical protein
MINFDGSENLWVEAHRQELLGMDVEAACALVRSAGFRPIVKVPKPGVAYAAAQWVNSVSMVCVDGTVRRVSPG